MSPVGNLSPELASRITTSANEARAAGLITPQQLGALTDGHISKSDHAIAGGLYGQLFAAMQARPAQSADERAVADRNLDIAYALWSATSQVDTRNLFEKAGDAVGEFVEYLGTQYAMLQERARQGIRNIK